MVDLNLPVPGVTYGTEENPVHGEMINAALGTLATALGTTFADAQIDGSDLVLTREDGDVFTLALPEASPEAIEAAVTDYLTENPPSGATDPAVAGFVTSGPLTTAALTAQIATGVSEPGAVRDAVDARVSEKIPPVIMYPTGNHDEQQIKNFIAAGKTNIEIADNGIAPAWQAQIPTPNVPVRIVGQGADRTVWQMGAGVQFGLSARGSKTQIGGTDPLTANAPAGTIQLSTRVDLRSALAVGDRILIRSNGFFGSRNYHRFGEIAQIATISDSAITLTAPLRYGYAMADAIQLYRYSFLRGVELRGMSFRGHPAATVPQTPFLLTWLESPIVDDVRVDGRRISVGFDIRECIRPVLNVEAYNVLDLANVAQYTWTGYGVQTRGCVDASVTVNGAGCRHLFDSSSLSNEPPDLRTRVRGVAADCVSAGWSSHGGSDELRFEGAIARNCGGGFVFRGRGTKGWGSVFGVTNPTSDVYTEEQGALPQSYKHGVMLGENAPTGGSGGTGGVPSKAGVALDFRLDTLDMSGGDASTHGVYLRYAQVDEDSRIDLGDVRLPAGASAVYSRFQDLMRHLHITGRVTNPGDAPAIDIQPEVAGKAPQDLAVDLDVDGYNGPIVRIAGRATSGGNNAKDVVITVRARGKNAAYPADAPLFSLPGYFDAGEGAVIVERTVARESTTAALVPSGANGGAGLGPSLTARRNVSSSGVDDKSSVLFASNGLFPTTGSPNVANVGTDGTNRVATWMLDASSFEVLGCPAVALPTEWAKFNIDVLWTNGGAGAGDVRWQSYRTFMGDGDALGAAVGAAVTDTAPVALTMRRTRLVSAAVNPGKLLTVRVGRDGANAADTLDNDAALVCVVISKA